MEQENQSQSKLWTKNKFCKPDQPILWTDSTRTNLSSKKKVDISQIHVFEGILYEFCQMNNYQWITRLRTQHNGEFPITIISYMAPNYHYHIIYGSKRHAVVSHTKITIFGLQNVLECYSFWFPQQTS